jgi:hypothetical protein
MYVLRTTHELTDMSTLPIPNLDHQAVINPSMVIVNIIIRVGYNSEDQIPLRVHKAMIKAHGRLVPLPRYNPKEYILLHIKGTPYAVPRMKSS